MEIVIPALLAVSLGTILPVSAAANAIIGRFVKTPVAAALINFIVGLIILLAVLATGILDRGDLSGVLRTPWWTLLGGACGALYVSTLVVTIPRLGAAFVTALVLFGQAGGALALDSLGWLGVQPVPVAPMRVAGLAVAVVAIWLLAGARLPKAALPLVRQLLRVRGE